MHLVHRTTTSNLRTIPSRNSYKMTMPHGHAMMRGSSKTARPRTRASSRTATVQTLSDALIFRHSPIESQTDRFQRKQKCIRPMPEMRNPIFQRRSDFRRDCNLKPIVMSKAPAPKNNRLDWTQSQVFSVVGLFFGGGFDWWKGIQF